MKFLYTIIQNIDGEIKVYGESRLASPNINFIKTQYSKFAHEWIHHSLQHATNDEAYKGAPTLMRLSDMVEICSVADVMSKAQDIHNEYITKSKQLDAELTQYKAVYDEQINTIATKMMGKDPIAPIEESTTSNTLYNIIQETGNDEFMICGNVIDNGSNSLEYHKQAYADLAPKWFQIAVKDYEEKWTRRPPVLIRLSDSAIMYSVLDYMPEVKAVYDEFERKNKLIEEESARLKAEYIENINGLIRVQVALVPF